MMLGQDGSTRKEGSSTSDLGIDRFPRRKDGENDGRSRPIGVDNSA